MANALFSSTTEHFAVLADSFENWLRRAGPNRPRASVLDLGLASGSNGASNETYRTKVNLGNGGGELDLVLRLPPGRDSVFQIYDMPRQFAFMQAVAAQPGVPHAPVRWLETDPVPLGCPFFVMDYIEGETASDSASYVLTGG